jgi:nicotinamidase-related amidase
MTTATTMELPSARPYPYKFRPESTALIIIDMQRDFVDYHGFGQIQCGNDAIFRKVRNIVPKTQRALEAARSLGLHVVHTREGHRPDLSDLPPSKRLRQISAPSGHHTLGIGDVGPMGRLLVRGEYGHDIIDELRPLPGEPVIDKPGKGSMWDTNLHRVLLARGITHLLFAGVTTECCVNTTARECADRGFETCVLADCTDGFDEGFYRSTLDMLCSYDGLFGFVGSSTELLKYMSAPAREPTAPPTPSPASSGDFSMANLRKHYATGQWRPTDTVEEISARIASYTRKDPAVWRVVAGFSVMICMHRWQNSSDLLHSYLVESV